MTVIYGHDAEVANFLQSAFGERMHHGWILAGPQGIGKAAIANQLALHLLADEAGPVSDEHPAARLMQAGSHPDFITLQRLVKDSGEQARNISVDQVRSIHRLLESAPSIAKRRVILIDSADELEAGGANALLKSLEEPPANTVFLLVSHSPSRLLPTIRSRCRMLRFSRLDDAAMRRALCSVHPELQGAELDQLLLLGKGAPGYALELANNGLDQLGSTLRTILRDGDPDNRQRSALARSLSGKAAKGKFEAFLQYAPAFLAEQAKVTPAADLGPVLETWEKVRDLAGAAMPLSLDPSAVAYEIGGLIAQLAQDSAVPAN
jgi:DNA polymerase-3 subunit delta'